MSPLILTTIVDIADDDAMGEERLHWDGKRMELYLLKLVMMMMLEALKGPIRSLLFQLLLLLIMKLLIAERYIDV
jgi:hypothetical protein